jgi:hypothetical protein
MTDAKNEAAGGASLSDAGFGFTVGQEIRLRVRVWAPDTGDAPGGLLGNRGDKLIVKNIGDATYHFPIAVHHPEVTDGTAFGVTAAEIEPWSE